MAKLAVSVEPTRARTGMWCPTCSMATRIEVEIEVTTSRGLHRVRTVAVCTEAGCNGGG